MPKRKAKISEYGRQLREKQELKRSYGLRESQFRKYVERAQKTGQTGRNLIVLLESRIDSFIYRSGFAKTMPQARQYVSHGLFLLNGKRITIPSILLRPGDIISPRKKEQFPELNAPKNYSWISCDTNKKECTLTKEPVFDEVDLPYNLNLVVQFYSR